MGPHVLLNVLVLVAVVIVLIWYPDRVTLIPLLLSRVPREEKKPADAPVAAPAPPSVPAVPTFDPNKTVVMPPRDRPRS